MKDDSLARRLTDRVRGSIRTDYPLAGLTTYRIGGPARVYFEPADAEDIEMMAEVLTEAEGEIPLLVLGRGSNVLISDSGFPGLVVRLGVAFSWIKAQPGDPVTALAAGSATPLPLLANWAARRSLAGLEFTVAIPGSVGGGVRMNAGAHGGEIADTLTSVGVFDVQSRETAQRSAADLALAYRHSGLSDHQIVLNAAFELSVDDERAIRDRMEGFRRHRAETQPGAVQNAGSTFKNPPGDSAGRLVEASGLKGFRVGTVAVSELHANFFVADDGALAQDVFDLVREVRRRVKEQMGVELEPEVRFVGSFTGGGD